MTMTIDTTGHIKLDGHDTGFGVRQEQHGTKVFTRQRLDGTGYRIVEMPHKRYSLAFDEPLSGVPGRAQFERDIRAVPSET